MTFQKSMLYYKTEHTNKTQTQRKINMEKVFFKSIQEIINHLNDGGKAFITDYTTNETNEVKVDCSNSLVYGDEEFFIIDIDDVEEFELFRDVDPSAMTEYECDGRNVTADELVKYLDEEIKKTLGSVYKLEEVEA